MSNGLRLPPDRVEFVILAFEGPDLYSLVGGLGVRVSELAQCLSSLGYKTYLNFVGDPRKPESEELAEGKLVYRRWCQWLSGEYPGGVYEGEARKVGDFTASVPEHVVERIVEPNAQQGKVTVILAEDWQTAGSVVSISRQLLRKGLDKKCVTLWNANNVFGFSGIDWESLRQACAITTVSRYMKHVMSDVGVNPLVIPNGIPRRMLDGVNEEVRRSLREAFPELLLCKVGRYHTDKRWLMAIEAVGDMKRLGMSPKLLVRGGTESHRLKILERAWEQGLVWSEIRLDNPSAETIAEEVANHRHADVLELCFFVPEEFLRALYAASDAVLANSGHEPFGLVGLEVMACGGVAFTGCSGEDYGHSFVNCVVIDSDDPREISIYVRDLKDHPEGARTLRERGRSTSELFLWETTVVGELFRKIEFVSRIRGVDLVP